MPKGRPSDQRPWLDGFAGASMGLFLGLMIGLSFSPVVASVVTALLAAVASWSVLFVKKDENKIDASATFRLIGFASMATLALLAGIYMRTHNTLSPSFESKVATWEKHGFSSDEAKALVLWKKLGSDPLGSLYIHKKAAFQSLGFNAEQAKVLAVRQILGEKQAASRPGKTPDRSDSGLFHDDAMADFNPTKKYGSPASALAVYSTGPEPWKEFAASLKGLDEEKQEEILNAVRNLFNEEKE